MRISFLERLPDPQAVLQVYAVIAVMLSAWTITAFLHRLPSWLLTLNIGEIFALFSYSMVVNLLESLIVLLLILGACVVLPSRSLRDDFAVRGTLLSIGVLGALMVPMRIFMQYGLGSTGTLLAGLLAVLLLTALFFVFSVRIRVFHSAVLWIADRLVVFLFILVPLFAFLSIYVIFRNIV